MRTTIPLKKVKIQHGLHLGFHAVVNEKKCFLILDTGASQTVFDKTRIELLLSNAKLKENKILSSGLGTKDMKSHSVKLKQFELGKIKLKNFNVMVLDLSHVNNTYDEMGLSKIDGVLGSDLLQKLKAIINFEKRTLILNQ